MFAVISSIWLLEVYLSEVLMHYTVHICRLSVVYPTILLVVVLERTFGALVGIPGLDLKNSLLIGYGLKRDRDMESDIPDGSIRGATLELKESPRPTI